MTETKMPVVVRCPKCNWRILDKVTVTSGVIKLKCPNCGRIVPVNLSLRRAGGLKYRLAVKAIK